MGHTRSLEGHNRRKDRKDGCEQGNFENYRREGAGPCGFGRAAGTEGRIVAQKHAALSLDLHLQYILPHEANERAEVLPNILWDSLPAIEYESFDAHRRHVARLMRTVNTRFVKGYVSSE